MKLTCPQLASGPRSAATGVDHHVHHELLGTASRRPEHQLRGSRSALTSWPHVSRRPQPHDRMAEVIVEGPAIQVPATSQRV